MPPKNYVPDYRLISEEELRQIIKEAEAELKTREAEQYNELKNNVMQALYALRSAFPFSEMMVYDQCHRCGEELEINVLDFVDTIVFNQ